MSANATSRNPRSDEPDHKPENVERPSLALQLAHDEHAAAEFLLQTANRALREANEAVREAETQLLDAYRHGNREGAERIGWNLGAFFSWRLKGGDSVRRFEAQHARTALNLLAVARADGTCRDCLEEPVWRRDRCEECDREHRTYS